MKLHSMLEDAPSTTSSTTLHNPFVPYLNSLQRIGAGNDNALAENQICNEFFGHIQVPHPLTEHILKELIAPDGNHIILTGHAGDGKSTIAFEIYKQLCDLPSDEPLTHPLAPREDLSTKISIIKDLSERDKKNDPQLLAEIFSHSRKFFLVSNTGTLLDLFKEDADRRGQNKGKLENKILKAISAPNGHDTFTINDVSFTVYNLALMDNLDLAQQVFRKMLDPERWNVCRKDDCHHHCPIYQNIDLITRYQDRICERIFLIYRRMYEYGSRLTMRQLTEHLAYLLTGGVDGCDVQVLNQQIYDGWIGSEYLFFNRFFGDNGIEPDPPAQELRAIQEINKQGIGNKISPLWERRLWLNAQGDPFDLGIPECAHEIDTLRSRGLRPDEDQPNQDNQAREQVRRMVYFLYDFKNPQEKTHYLSTYLNSPYLLSWIQWQEPGYALNAGEETDLSNRIYHVIQEHFTGIRLPEQQTYQHERFLYITLSREQALIRQATQILLAKVEWSDFKLVLLPRTALNQHKPRVDLILQGNTAELNGIQLLLALPFLDYVCMRHFGEVGQNLNRAYLGRLERFRAQIQDRASYDDTKISIIKLRTNKTYQRQVIEMRNGYLEVR